MTKKADIIIYVLCMFKNFKYLKLHFEDKDLRSTVKNTLLTQGYTVDAVYEYDKPTIHYDPFTAIQEARNTCEKTIRKNRNER